jgi:hypothetical protein
MPVDGIVAGVAEGADEPAAIGPGARVEHRVGGLDPVDLPRGFLPEAARIGGPARVNLMVAALGRRHGDFPVFLPHGTCVVLGLAWFDVVAGKRAVVTATFGQSTFGEFP